MPSSKSQTLRAIVFGAMAHGVSQIEKALASPDTEAMLAAVQMMGAKVWRQKDTLTIEGFAGQPHVPDDVIQCGNSGLVLRFIGALAALLPQYTVLTGDASIRHRRCIQPLLRGLEQLGAFATSSRGDGFAPILIRGPLTQRTACIQGQDSQPVSGLLIASALAPHPMELFVQDPGEKAWVDVTLDWFDRLQIRYQRKGHEWYRVEGRSTIAPFSYQVPGDWSSAAFPIAAALLTQSDLTLENLDPRDIQGDRALIQILEQMGAHFTLDAGQKRLLVKKGERLQGRKIDVNPIIDALPILAVIGCFAEGKTELYNGAIARSKESDRIEAIVRELKKMGAQIEERPDGLIVQRSVLQGADLYGEKDHRLVMALTVAALAAQTPSTLLDPSAVAKTYPSFLPDIVKVGGCIRPLA